MLNGLSLFSGIGGIDVALSGYVKTKAYCEIDTYCQSVLLSRMLDGSLDRAPIWDDIRNFDGSTFSGYIDIIFGGFPCQDISVAGKGVGLEGERSGLFFEIVRLAKEIKPKFIFLENVPAITSRGGLRVVREITAMGYDCRWCVISAASVGALHRRERWFLLAHSKHDGASSSENRRGIGECTSSGKEQGQQEEGIGETKRASCLSADVANANNAGNRTSGYDTARQSTPIEVRNYTQFEFSGYSEDVADTNSKRFEKHSRTGSIQEGQSRSEYSCNDVADATSESADRYTKREEETFSLPRECSNDGNTLCQSSEQTHSGAKSELPIRESRGESTRQYWPFKSRDHWQEVVSTICRVDDGVPNRVDRLKSLGNAVVPIQVKEAFEILMGIK